MVNARVPQKLWDAHAQYAMFIYLVLTMADIMPIYADMGIYGLKPMGPTFAS